MKTCSVQASSVSGQECGGRGHCVCGSCECAPGYSGPSCDCTQDTSSCRSPKSPHLICSNRGKCECGKCICYER